MTSAAPAAPSIEVHGDVQGSIVYGDHNFVVNSNHGTIVYQAARPQVSRRTDPPPRPRQPHLFLDRTAEIGHISAALSSNQPVALYGMEGAGKSTLLRQVASGASPETYPDGVVLLNGSGRSGVPEGLDDVAQNAFNALFESEPVVKVTAGTARTYLGHVRALFVFDEMSLPAESLAQLPDLVPAGGLMWAAPYAPRGETARSLSVGSLPRADAIALFWQTAEAQPDPAQQATVDEICWLVQDLPLGVVTIARWMRERQSTPERALLILNGQSAKRAPDGVARACTAVLTWLGHAAKRLFSLAGTADGPTVDRAALLEASGLMETAANKGFAELESYGFLQAHSPALGMHPAYKQFIRASLPASPHRLQSLHDIFLREAQAHRGDWNYLRGELGNLLGAFESAVNAKRAGPAAELIRLIVPLLVLRGHWDLWHYVFERLTRLAGQRAINAWALHEIGTRALALGERAVAERLLREALQIRQSLRDEVGAAFSRHNLDILLGPPPPPPSQPAPPKGPPWLTVLLSAALGGLAMLALVGVVAAAVYCIARRCGPLVPVATATPKVELVVPSATGVPTARLAPTASVPTNVPAPEPSSTPAPPTHPPTVTLPPIPVELTLTPVADVYVNSLSPDNNLGDSPELSVGVSPDSEFPSTTRSFIRFDLSVLPPGARILRAVLNLSQIAAFDTISPDNPIGVYAVAQPWDEFKLTWNTSQLEFGDIYAITPVPLKPGSYEWEITELVHLWQSGELMNYGLALVGEEGQEFNLRVFAGREMSSDNRPPLLFITYSVP